jgi:predicted DNA-binding protein (MmcQ/YjbR family)
MKVHPVERLRQIAGMLPEAAESVSVHHPSFKVRGKSFAMFSDGTGRPAVWIKAPPGGQDELVASDPERFFVPPYLGPRGWVGVWLDHAVDWDEIAELVTDGYRLAAPKRLVQQLDQA